MENLNGFCLLNGFLERMKKINSQYLQDLCLRNQHDLQNPNETYFLKEAPFLALDYGEKYCGLAWSLDGQCILPLEVVLFEDLMEKISFYLLNKSIKTLVMGLPVSAGGKENHICKRVRHLKKQIESLYGISVKLINEQYSSSLVLDIEGRKDDLAACKILEFYLQDKSRD